jgi:ADP-ribose pyrophosphatase
MEERISSERPFRGKLVSVRVDRVRLPNGRETTREVVEHPGAVAVLPVMDDGALVLVRQYRYAAGRSLLEVPAGTREPAEPAEETAVRELREETGLDAGQIELLARFFVSPGWCTEELLVYRARDLRQVGAAPEGDEVLEVITVRADEVIALIDSGEIADAKTITAVLAHLCREQGAGAVEQQDRRPFR